MTARPRHHRLLPALLVVVAVWAILGMPGPSTLAQTAPGVTATKTATLATDVDGDGQADPGDTIGYTVTITNSGTGDATGVAFDDPLDPNTTLVDGSIKTTPLATNDAYSAIGNVGLDVAAPGLLANDRDVDGGDVTITASPTTTDMGGTLSVASDGAFTFMPAPGFEGDATFQYTVTDDEGASATATVTITVADVIWFIDSSVATSGDGTILAPFKTIGAFNTTAADDTGDIIFLADGTYTGAGFTLLNNQKLIGDGVNTTLATAAGLTVPTGSRTLPTPSGTNPVIALSSGTAITLGQNNTVTGVTVANTAPTTTAISGSSFGTLTLTETLISGQGRALNLSSGTMNNASFDGVTVSASTIGGISLQSLTGTTTIPTLSLATTAGTALSATSAGTLNINSGGSSTATISSSGGRAIDIDNTALGIRLTGLTATSSGVPAVELTSNTGTISLTGAANTVSTTGAIAVDIQNTTIGSGGVTFQKVDASGGTHGIRLVNAGSAGFTITGTGTTDASGGTITGTGSMATGIEVTSTGNISLANMKLTNANQVDGGGAAACDSTVNSACNGAVELRTVSGAQLSNVDITGAVEQCIVGNTVTNLDIIGSVIENCGDGPDEFGIYIRELYGSSGSSASSIQSSTVRGSSAGNVFIVNSAPGSGGTPDLLQITGSTFANLVAPNGSNGLLHVAQGTANMRLEISGSSTFTNNRGVGLNVQAAGSGQNELAITATSFAPGTEQDAAIRVIGAGTSTIDLNIAGLTGLTSTQGTVLGIDGSGSATIRGVIQNNTVTIPAGTNANGIEAILDINSHGILSIIGNTVANGGSGTGIRLASREGTGTIDATVTNNTVTSQNMLNNNGFFFASGNGMPGESNRVCVNLSSNTGAGGTGRFGYYFEQWTGTTFQIQGISPSPATTEAQVAAYVQSKNTGSVGVEPAFAGATIINYTNATCATPPAVAGPGTIVAALAQRSPQTAIPVSFVRPAATGDLLALTSAVELGRLAAVESLGASTSLLQQVLPQATAAVSLDIGTLAPGQSITITYRATINSDLPATTTQVCNQGTVSGTNFTNVLTDDPDTSAAGDPTCVATPQADLAITKTASADPVAVGADYSYTLTVTNNGPSEASGATVTDTLPAGVAVVSASGTGWTCNEAGGTVTCSRADALASGASFPAISIAVTAPSAPGTLQNAATVASTTHDPDSTDNSTTLDTEIKYAVDLSITKTDGVTSAVPGTTATYTITAANSGPSDAVDASVADTFPIAFTNPTWTCVGAGGGTCTASGSGNIADTVDLPAGGSVTYTVTGTIGSSATGSLSNTATVSIGGDYIDTNTANNSATDTDTLTPQADLSITKIDSPDPVIAGDNLVYTLTIANAGPSDATTIAVTDALPAGVAFVSAIGTNWTCGESGGTVTCTLPSLAASASSDIAITITTGDDGTLSNTATVSATTTDPTPGNNSATATTTVLPPGPNLSLTKSDGGLTDVVPDGSITYTLSYANAVGVRDAASVVITETVPAGTTADLVASTGWTCAAGGVAGDTCTYDVGTLAAGASGSATFTVTVDATVAAGVLTIDNTAVISHDTATSGDDQDTTDNTATESTPLTAAPDFMIGKSDGDASAVPGETLTYTLSYANIGTRGATGVTLTETVPAYTSLDSAASTAGWVCTPDATAGSTCTLLVGTVEPGGSGTATFAVTVDAAVPAGVEEISNTATIADDGTNGTDADTANNTTTELSPLNAAPDLAITKSDGDTTVQPSGTVTYTLDYSNIGTQDATGVVITETVPASATFNPGASAAGWSCTPNGQAGSTCTMTVGALAAGSSGSVTFALMTVSPVPAGLDELSNTASIADDGANGADLDPANNTATDTTPIDAAPDLSLTKSDGDATATPGGTVAYTLTWDNAGDQDATGVTITETVPANATFNAAASTTGWTCTPDNDAGSTCTLAVGAVNVSDAAATATFAITVDNPIPAGVTELSNTATIADDGSNGADPVPANNSASDTTPIDAAPDLTLTKDDGDATALPGDTIVYTLTYTNNGNQGATGIVLTDVVPANTTFDASQSTADWSCANGSPAGTSCTFTVSGQVAGGGGSGTVAFAVTVDASTPPEVTDISNTASVADDGANGTDPTPADNSATDTTSLARADVVVAKVATTVVRPSGVIAYTVTATNQGDAPAASTVITDTLPAGVTLDASSLPAGCTELSTGVVECDAGTLDAAGGANDSTSFTFEAIADAGVADGTDLVNAVTVSTSTPEWDDTNNSASATTRVEYLVDVAFEKSVDRASVRPGAPLTWAITIVNGGDPLSNVVLTDTLPDGVTVESVTVSPPGALTCSGDMTITCTPAGGVIGLNFSATVTIATTVDADGLADGDVLANAATLTHHRGSETASAQAVVSYPQDLAVDKRLRTIAARAGEVVRYDITVTNSATDGVANDVVLVDELPDNATFVDVDAPAGWTCAENNGVLRCTTPTLAPGVDAVFVVRIRLDDDARGLVTNRVVVSSADADPRGGNNVDVVRFGVAQGPPVPQPPITPTPEPSGTPTETPTEEPTETPTEQPGTFTYDLSFRWTLITWYGPDGVSPEDALRGAGAAEGGDDIFDAATAIFGWDAEGQGWLGFFPNALDIPGANDLTALQYGHAYWIAINDRDGAEWTISTDKEAP